MTITVGAIARVTVDRDTWLIAVRDPGPASVCACHVAADAHNVASPPRQDPGREGGSGPARRRAAMRRAAWQASPR